MLRTSVYGGVSAAKMVLHLVGYLILMDDSNSVEPDR